MWIMIGPNINGAFFPLNKFNLIIFLTLICPDGTDKIFGTENASQKHYLVYET